jgi:hypothetical protein
MKTLRFVLLSGFLLASNIVFGQHWDRAPIYVDFLGKTYNKAFLNYENGDTKYCYAAIPKTCNQKTIYYKADAGSPVEEIQGQLLKEITILNKDSSVYIFERVNQVLKPGDKPKEKEWLFVEISGYANLYLRIDKYKIDNQGTLILIAEGMLATYFVKKKNDQNAILIAYQNPYPSSTVVGANKPLKTNGPAFFAEDKELVGQITSGKYTSRDIKEIVNLYNKFMNGK